MIQELKEELLSLYQEGSFRFECDDDDFEKSVIAKLPIKSPTKYTCIASMYLWRGVTSKKVAIFIVAGDLTPPQRSRSIFSVWTLVYRTTNLLIEVPKDGERK